MIMSKAVRDLFPTLRLRIEHSVSGGYYTQLINAEGMAETPKPGDLDAIKARMERLWQPMSRLSATNVSQAMW